jgi:serine protease Do
VIEPASSGGPLMGSDGRVVGITSRMDGRSAFAVPANTVRSVVQEIESAGKVVRPYIGLRGVAEHGGVQVTKVHPNGPADTAGIRAGDVIESIDDKPAATYPDLLVEVARHAPGDAVKLSVVRDGMRSDVTITLAERPATLPGG